MVLFLDAYVIYQSNKNNDTCYTGICGAVKMYLVVGNQLNIFTKKKKNLRTSNWDI